jgi:hypothetical protein
MERSQRHPLLYSIAAITPVLGVSDVCFRQSVAYARNLFDVSANSPVEQENWGKQSKMSIAFLCVADSMHMHIFYFQVFDSNGKAPDGSLSETTTFCDFARFWLPEDCPKKVESFSSRHPYPKGGAVAIGNFQGCLDIRAENKGSDDLVWERYCTYKNRAS